jgi:hypothetical protein
MKKFAALTVSLFLLLLPSLLFAQEGKSEIGELMRSNGRIYVVVAVMLTILAGLIFYLVRLDRKISRMERES